MTSHPPLHNYTSHIATLTAMLEDTRDLLANCLDYGNEVSKQHAQMQVDAISQILSSESVD